MRLGPALALAPALGSGAGDIKGAPAATPLAVAYGVGLPRHLPLARAPPLSRSWRLLFVGGEPTTPAGASFLVTAPPPPLSGRSARIPLLSSASLQGLSRSLRSGSPRSHYFAGHSFALPSGFALPGPGPVAFAFARCSPSLPTLRASAKATARAARRANPSGFFTM